MTVHDLLGYGIAIIAAGMLFRMLCGIGALLAMVVGASSIGENGIDGLNQAMPTFNRQFNKMSLVAGVALVVLIVTLRSI